MKLEEPLKRPKKKTTETDETTTIKSKKRRLQVTKKIDGRVNNGRYKREKQQKQQETKEESSEIDKTETSAIPTEDNSNSTKIETSTPEKVEVATPVPASPQPCPSPKPSPKVQKKSTSASTQNGSLTDSPDKATTRRDTRRSRRTNILESGEIRMTLDLDAQNYASSNSMSSEQVDWAKFYAICLNLHYWNKRYQRKESEIFSLKKFKNFVPNLDKFQPFTEILQVWEHLIENSDTKICEIDQMDDHVTFLTPSSTCSSVENMAAKNLDPKIQNLTSMIYPTINNNADFIILDTNNQYEPTDEIKNFAKDKNFTKTEIIECIFKTFCLHIHQMSSANKAGLGSQTDTLISGFNYIKFCNFPVTQAAVYNCIKKLIGSYKDARDQGTKICNVDSNFKRRFLISIFDSER